MNKNVKLILFTAIAVLCLNQLKAQICGSSNIEMDHLVKTADLIITGKVIDKQSFWNNTQTNIYTQHTIEVKQSSKQASNKIYIITEGGTVNNISFQIFGAPGLTLNSEGIFFLNKNYSIAKAGEDYYNLLDVAFYNNTTQLIERNNSIIRVDNFNRILQQINKKSFSFTKSHPAKTQTKIKRASITGINPTTIVAGNNEVLTITGNGFRSLVGSAKISMRDPNNTNTSVFVDIDASHIKSWTDTKIQLVVPGDEITTSFPGVASGKIRLTDQSGLVTTSGKTVEVRYNKKVYNGIPIRIRAKKTDGSIPFYAEQKLINQGALPAIERALETWNCATGSNLTYAGIVNNACREYDEINVICYDPSVINFNLAVTRVISRNCTSINVADQMDADITFNPTINWTFNDDIKSDQFHFESVLIHELGHTFMLSHVSNINDILYPLLNNGLLKTELADNDVEGGLDIMNKSTSAIKCSSYGPVISFAAQSCKGCSNVTNIIAKNFTKSSVYLSWDKIQNSKAYNFRYRFNGSGWHQYQGNSNSAILFNLPPRTTVECRLSAFCNNFENSGSETVYRFTTLSW